MLGNLLTTVILWVYDTIQSLFSTPDYRITDTSLEYFLDTSKTPIPEELDDFWYEESDVWDDETESVFKTLNSIEYKNTKIPENVTKTAVRVKYWYNNTIYKYLTYNMDHPWPPPRKSGIVFNIPIVSAVLLDSDDKPIKDILNKIKRYAGPRKDFHNEKVKISDMLYYDIDTLKNNFPKIKLTSAIGGTKVVSTVDGYITDLQVP
tara:strand:+ start:1282 stop:1899 length:618 start_codon:yes stop_codon:yes gene_type:complete